jgi:2-polyprenyl-3-methyl-5-hydroxy-6-metoxy-1,4-benzoquinol methylase
MKLWTGNTHRTAIGRKAGSRPVQRLWTLWKAAAHFSPAAPVLDWGCGRGADVRWLKKRNLDVDGYDPHPPFGFHQLPKRSYRTVLCIYVVNVLPSVEQRFACLAQAWSFVEPGGALVVVSRSTKEIAAEAKARSWKRWGDGFKTGNATFQRGHTDAELCEMLWRLPLMGEDCESLFPDQGEFAAVVGVKKS